MQFTDEHIYSTPLARIEKMYYDTAFVPRKYTALGLQDIQVIGCNGGDTDFFVSCSFKMPPTIPVPGFIGKLLGNDILLDVSQTDRWNRQTNKGELDIQLHAFDQVTIRADMSLEEHPQGAVNRFVWTVECSLPLLGGKLADFLGRDIQQKSADDHKASMHILGDY